MISTIIIQNIRELPSDFDKELLPASTQEGFEPIKWLMVDWENKKNQFAKPGEAFYAARYDGRLVGVCGVNRDPYTKDDSMGRLRRLYVLPQVRRMGVGRQLVERAIIDAQNHFNAVRLRTLDDQSASFFEAAGFRAIEGQDEATHEMKFDVSDRVDRA